MTTLRKFVTELGYKTDQRSFRAAEGDAASLKKEMRSLSATAGSAGKALTQAIAGFVTFQAGSSFIKGVIQANVENEKLAASLETIEGSAVGADKALAQITKFTSTTPFRINEVAEAFISLKNQGLDASEESMTSFGNTAASMGKPLGQFVDAVADATRGSNERLLEFGISAEKQGKKTEFLFRGQKTVVANNAADIQAFLKTIGDTDFAGAMDRQMDTLGGRFSNLQDNAQQFAISIGKGGLNDAIKDVADSLLAASSGGGDLGSKIGQALGDAVRLTSKAVGFLVAHLDEVKIGLAAVGALLATQKVIAFAQAISVLGAQMGVLTRKILIQTTALLANPIFLIATALTAGIAAIVLFRTEIAAWIEETAGGASAFGALAGIIQIFTDEIIPMFASTISTIFEAFAPIVGIVGELFGVLASLFAAVLPPIMQLVGIIVKIRLMILAAIVKVFAVLMKPILFMVKLIAKVLGFIGKIIGKFVVMIAKVAEAIITPIASAFDSLFGVISGFVDTAGALLFGFFDAVADIGATIFEPVESAFMSFVNFVRGIVRKIPRSLLPEELEEFAYGSSGPSAEDLRILALEEKSLATLSAGGSKADDLFSILGGGTSLSGTQIGSMAITVQSAPDMAPSELQKTFAGGVRDAFDKPSVSLSNFSPASD